MSVKKIIYSKCNNDSTITKTKQSDILNTSTAVISGVTNITLNDVYTESSENELKYVSSSSVQDILFNGSDYNFNTMNLSSTKKNVWKHEKISTYMVNSKILKIKIIFEICNYSNDIQNPVDEIPFVKITVINEYDGTIKQKIFVQSISPNFTISQKIPISIVVLFLDNFTHTKANAVLLFEPPTRINGEYFRVNSNYIIENEGIITGSEITNTKSNQVTVSSYVVYEYNYTPSSNAVNVHYYTPQIYRWYSPFYYGLSTQNAVIFTNADKIITYSYELIENCSNYALTTTADLNLRIGFYMNQTTTTYSLEECFFSDEVNEAMNTITGMSFTALTLNTVVKGSITTLSKCLDKLLTINMSKLNALGLSVLTTSQNVVNSVVVSEGRYKYCGLGNIILEGYKIGAKSTKNGEVIANSLTTITIKDGITYSSFLILPEAAPDQWNIECDVNTFLLSGWPYGVFYRTNNNRYTRITDADEYMAVKTCYN